jgi:thiol-disulfide isomerase/thioredoxin
MKRSGLSLALLTAAVLGAAPVMAAVTAPIVAPVTSVPLAPYNTKASDNARVRAAAARAKAAHKLLLVDFGGNWCSDCRMLSGLMAQPAAKAFLDKHYEIVLVDVGRMDKNLEIPARYGIPKVRAVPAVVVVAPSGRVLNPGDEFALSDANSMNPQVVMNKLAGWVK